MKRYGVLLIILLLIFGLSACTPKDVFPSDGVWYCADLQAQFTADYVDTYISPDYIPVIDENENYVIVNGDRIASKLSGDHGATYVWIICQEWEHPDYDCGEIIYAFEFVSLSDTEYVLKDDNGKHYTFLRIRESQ